MNQSKLPSKKSQGIYGYHLTMELYNCRPDTVGDIRKGYSYLDELPELLKARKLSPPFIIYTDEKEYPDKAGLSGWVPITDYENRIYSGVSIHTLTPTNFISIDIYAPREFDPKRIKRFTSAIFQPKLVEERYFVRGDEFSVPSP